MMFNYFLLLFVFKLTRSFEFNSDIYGNKFNRVKLNNQDVYHTKSNKDSSKWLVFPLQMSYHDSYVKSLTSSKAKMNSNDNEMINIDTSLVVHHEDHSFWKTYHKYLNLHHDVEMKLTQEVEQKSFSMKVKRYDQYIYGFKVFGGDYKVTIGAHDGITQIHGHSFPTI